MVQDRVIWQAPMNKIMNLWITQKVGFLDQMSKYLLLKKDPAP
jgi:hypothetical protein